MLLLITVVLVAVEVFPSVVQASIALVDKDSKLVCVQQSPQAVFQYKFVIHLSFIATDSLGRMTSFEYDAAGNVTKITDPNNQSTRFEHETNFNRVKKLTDALNQVTEFTYDPATGNLLTVKDPLHQVTTIAYNPVGQPTSVQGPIATEPPTTFAYDTNGNLLTTTDPLGNATQRAYDAVSRLTALTDPRGLSTQFRYDGLNRVTEIADARQGITRFAYDPNGNLLSVADAKNQTTTYTYNNMDRLSTRKDALNRPESYTYDLAGNLSQFTDRKNQQTTFVYDALNRRTTATYPDATTTFTYDSVGRLAKTSDTATGAGTIDFAYDVLDRLIQETTGQGSVAYQYDVLGRRTNMVANGQQPVTYGYDAANRLTQVAQGSLTVGLGYDNANRRTSLTYPNGTSTSYSYDVASRLTNINHLGPSGIIEALTYQYDAAGNRTSLTRNNAAASLLPAAVASATYDVANEQTAFAGATLTYDANGNLTNEGVNTYQWDARNRLVSMSGVTTASFNYDALGRRTSKVINSVASQFLYDGNDIVQEIGSGAVGAGYVGSLNVDEPFIRQGITTEFYHGGALGSVAATSDISGVKRATYSYDPFGTTTVSGSISPNTFQFTARENDGDGLYYYRARYYSPRMGRFVSEDPIGMAGGLNYYSYVRNNPVNYSDPSGEIVTVPLIAAGALVGGILNTSIYYATTSQFTWQGAAGAFAGGAVSGAIGTVATPLSAAAGLGTGFGGTAVVNALAGAVGNSISAAFDPCQNITPSYLASSAFYSSVGGAFAQKYFPTVGMQVFGQVGFPRTWSAFIPQMLGGNAGPNANAIVQGGAVGGLLAGVGPNYVQSAAGTSCSCR